jgi:hypothetical protein
MHRHIMGTLSDAPARPCPPPSLVRRSLSRYEPWACSVAGLVRRSLGRSARHALCNKACTSRAALRSLLNSQRSNKDFKPVL